MVGRLRDEWLEVGLAACPADRPAAQAAIAGMYRLAGQRAPRFVWADSPATAALAIWALAGETGDSLYDVLGDGLHEGLEYSLEASLRDILDDHLVNSLYDSLDDSLLTSLRDSLRVSPEAGLGSLRTSLRASLDASLASLDDEPSLARGMLRLNDRCFWGQHDAPWIAYYQAPAQLGIVTYEPGETARLDLWANIARSCGWWWPFKYWCIVSERPELVRTEPRDPGRGTERLHCADGPAVQFGDGWPAYAWHGRVVPAWVIENPAIEKIAQEPNVEVRRCAIEAFGWERFIAAAGLELVGSAPDPGNRGQLLALFEVPERLWGSPVRVLRCVNGTPERDGTRRVYGLTVPARITGPVEAAAWAAGLTEDQYASMQRRT